MRPLLCVVDHERPEHPVEVAPAVDQHVVEALGTDCSRFYYVVLNFSSGDGIDYDWGYSKTSSPNSAADFCKYRINYGYDPAGQLPDYEKMGDTKDFIVFGANVFNFATGGFISADAQWITKPPAGSSCQNPSLFKLGLKKALKNANGSPAFTLEPANQTDNGGKGYIVSADFPGSGSASHLEVFSVTKDLGTGNAIISGAGKAVAVTSFSQPPNAPQKGTAAVLDTLDSRLTLAVSAVDPGHGNAVGIWVQHAVAGGAGSEVRWYEIKPVGQALLQSGKATSASLYVYNGATSPDRVVNGSTKMFGDSMVLGFDTSSSAAFEAFQMVSKAGGGAQSPFVLIKQSPGFNQDFSCSPAPCRWGDYGSATPDPGAPITAPHGQVWLTSMWNVASANSSDVDWRTQNAGVKV